MHPCLVAGDSCFQDTRIFFIPSNKLGHNLHALSLVHNSKLLGNPPCADFPVSQIIMQYGICGSITDIQMCSHFKHCYPSVFSNHGIRPVNVVLYAWCWWPTRTTFISNMCSTRFKPFHPLIDLSLTHGALSILSQHTMVNFDRFHSFCPKKPHYTTLFFNGAILQRASMYSPHCCHSTEGRALYCTWLKSSIGIVNTAQCTSSSLSWLPCNLKIAYTFWFTLVCDILLITPLDMWEASHYFTIYVTFSSLLH